jgi:subtilisin family serine protease
LTKGNREKAKGYTAGSYSKEGDLLVPVDGRTYASQSGSDVYVYKPNGGMSWAAPWIAGLATLGFQVNPHLKPADIRRYIVESADNMPYGKVVNPAKFLKMCQAGIR